MRSLLVFWGVVVLTACGTARQPKELEGAKEVSLVKEIPSTTIIPISEAEIRYAMTITAAELKAHLYTFASDDFEGRDTGEPGQKKAAAYLKNQYETLGIPSPIAAGDYFQEIPESYFHGGIKTSENVVAYIKGTDKADELVVLSAHYDHVGVDAEGNVYNGADDDGSGTVALLEIAQAFEEARKAGNGPRRSLLFLHVTGEEKGLYGSKFYTDNPIFPLENTIADLNTDMIGRIDDAHKENPNYIYLIGSDRLSTELHKLSEQVNKKYTQLELDYTYNAKNDPNRFYYRSDHYNFAKNNIPIIFYFNGVHEDYHKHTDTPDKIEYDLLTKRTKLIFHTAWEIANQEERITADKL